ncbi:MAG: hypothetical protein ACYCPF_03580 [Streptosporangiaceae bacterium]
MPDDRAIPDLLDQAVEELHGITDPERRLIMANLLDDALANARTAVVGIKRDAVNEMRGPQAGYSTIAARLGLTKGRVQQIANAPRRPHPAAFAFRDENGTWHGEPGRVKSGVAEAETYIAFDPADKYNPLAGQVLTVRYADMEYDDRVSLYTLPVRLRDGSQYNVRMTNAVMDALFGPANAGTPQRTEWEALRARRQMELGE